MVNDDPLPPWFSGLGLVSECASHYELEQSQDGDSGSAAGQSPGGQASEEKSVLGLEGLAPITIFVGANNSGKSRLMREIFLQEKFYRFKLSVTQEDGTTCGVNPIIEEAVSFARGETELNLYGGEEYPIYQLGDGLQSLIICTYPIVTEQKPGSLFFIEEPDLGMHPSLQRSFVDVLKSYHLKKGHQFFLTTHSNHLLDLLEDDELVSIFSFSEKQIGPRQ